MKRRKPNSSTNQVTSFQQQIVDVQFIEDGVKFSCPIEKVKNKSNLCVGDIRKVRWMDGRYYPAKIININAGGNTTKTENAQSMETQLPDTQLAKSPNTLEAAHDAGGKTTKTENAQTQSMETQLPETQQAKSPNTLAAAHDLLADDAFRLQEIESSSAGVTPTDIFYVDGKGMLVDSDGTEVTVSNEFHIEEEAVCEENLEYMIDEPVGMVMDTNATEITISNNSHIEVDTVCEDILEYMVDEPVGMAMDLNATEIAISNNSPIEEDTVQDETLEDTVDEPSNTSVSKPQKPRVWDRKNFCLYCKTLVTNFSRHIVKVHPLEKEVISYTSINDADEKERKKKRQLITDDLRRRGNYLYNASLSDGNNFLPARRTVNKNLNTSFNYVSCRFCLGAFSRKTFYRHRKKCSVKSSESLREKTCLDNTTLGQLVFGSNSKMPVTKSDGIVLVPNIEGATDRLKTKILPILQKDEIGLIAMNDKLIIRIAAQFLSNHLEQKDEYSTTKKLRDAAKLLKECLKDEEITCFADCFNPKKFKFVMECVQNLCGHDQETGTVSVIGMPARMSYVILEGANILINEAISANVPKHVKDKIKSDVDDFLQLFKSQWKYIVSTNAEKTRKKKASLKTKLMPDDDDIKIVIEKIKISEKEYSEKLTKEVDPVNYENLCKGTIAHIIIFNRRRAGEVARAELEYYINRIKQDEVTDDVLNTLTEEERKILPTLTVFMVPGKLVHSVPILLTKEMKLNIDLLVSCRLALQIPSENKLLFARVHTMKPFDGSKIIRDYRGMCKLQKPSDLTSIGLRHHIATKSQIVNKPNYTENVCQFMGHSTNIHKQNYRLPLQAIQKGQIGCHLMKMAGTTQMSPSKSTPSTSISISQSNSEEILNQITPTKNQNRSQTRDEDELWSPSQHYYDSESSVQPSPTRKSHKKNVVAKKKWTDDEKSIVITTFIECLKEKKEPGMSSCLEVIKKNPCLAGRTWKHLNALIHNYNTGKTKFPPQFQHLLE